MVIDVKSYEERENTLALLKILALGSRELALGQYQDADCGQPTGFKVFSDAPTGAVIRNANIEFEVTPLPSFLICSSYSDAHTTVLLQSW